jgi:superfamily II DNA or RNA helicase
MGILLIKKRLSKLSQIGLVSSLEIEVTSGMKEQESKTKKQKEVVDLYKKVNPLRCALVLSTGFGKSKVALDIIDYVKPKQIIILVNSDILRDENWEAEFKLWGKEKLYKEKVEMVNYQTAYKWKKEEKKLDGSVLVIADEVDFAGGTVEYSKFFTEYPLVRLIGLTGFISNLKRVWFRENLPVLYEYTARNAIDDKVLNKTKYVFIKYDLSRNMKDIKVTYKKGNAEKSFTQSQNNAYDYNEKKVDAITKKRKEINDAYFCGQYTKNDYYRELKSVKYLGDMITKTRSDILLNNIASASITKNLIKSLLGDENNKVVVFSKRTAQVDAVVGPKYSYHGKMTKVKAAKNFHNFSTGVIRVLGVCDKINRGVNIPGLNLGIFESFYSSDTDASQRLGRLMRLDAGEEATVYMLLPYYMRKEKNETYTCQETAQVGWARNMLKNSNINIKDCTVWDYRTVKDD